MINLNLAGIGMTSQRTRSRLVQRLRSEGISNEKVLQVMENTPRHIFIDEALSHRAYEDTALPIGMGQTISQPFIVARMTETLIEHLPCHDKVLEIGTGSGYQAAVLAHFFKQVFTVERIRPLQLQAKRRLSDLRLRNVNYLHADGFEGWPEQGPYAAIIVTAAPQQVPPRLLEQLKDGGRMIIPVGASSGAQQLQLIERNGSEFETTPMDMVRFVPLVAGKDN